MSFETARAVLSKNWGGGASELDPDTLDPTDLRECEAEFDGCYRAAIALSQGQGQGAGGPDFLPCRLRYDECLERKGAKPYWKGLLGDYDAILAALMGDPAFDGCSCCYPTEDAQVHDKSGGKIGLTEQ